MLILGHSGITLGITLLMEKSSNIMYRNDTRPPMDYRLVLIGSMLPDILDKPLVLLTSSHIVHSARAAAHSLTFLILLFILGLFEWIYLSKTRITLLAYCSGIHLLLDEMWKYPKLLLWPLYSWLHSTPAKTVPTIGRTLTDQVKIITESVSTLDYMDILLNPFYIITELIGGIILAYVLFKLISGKSFGNFIRTGDINQNITYKLKY